MQAYHLLQVRLPRCEHEVYLLLVGWPGATNPDSQLAAGSSGQKSPIPRRDPGTGKSPPLVRWAVGGLCLGWGVVAKVGREVA